MPPGEARIALAAKHVFSRLPQVFSSPAPDVFVEAARRVGVQPAQAAAVEDSHNGILAARAASMTVLAVPNHEFPPDPGALAQADVVLGSLDELTVDAVLRAAAR